jgi:hypothetical protein
MNGDDVTDAAPPKNLIQKLHEVASAINTIAKNGRNDHQHYDYVQESDVKRVLREELLSRGIIVIPSTVPGSLAHTPATGGKGFVTTIEIEYHFIDTTAVYQGGLATVGDLKARWVGAGSDIGGDKGLYKAYAGGLKYMLLTLFLIPTGDDPEGEASSVAPEAHPDDARPAAPSIPIDRARKILETAVLAGLASEEGEGTNFKVELKPVFKAKLASVGVDSGKVGHLNVDQAEDVEKWLAKEVEANA